MSDEPTPIHPEYIPAEEAKTMEVTLVGGPLGRSSEFLIDGQSVPNVSRAAIIADASGLIKVQVEQIKLHVDVKIQVAGWTRKVVATANFLPDEGKPLSLTAEGASTREALANLMANLPAEEFLSALPKPEEE